MPESFRGSGLYKLDNRFRLVLPGGLSKYVKWFDPTQELKCLAVPGHEGGIAVFAPAVLKEHQEMMVTLEGREDLRPEDMGSATYELARGGMLTWEVTIPSGRLTLPLGARELGIVPAEEHAMVALWRSTASLRSGTRRNSSREPKNPGGDGPS